MECSACLLCYSRLQEATYLSNDVIYMLLFLSDEKVIGDKSALPLRPGNSVRYLMNSYFDLTMVKIGIMQYTRHFRAKSRCAIGGYRAFHEAIKAKSQ